MNSYLTQKTFINRFAESRACSIRNLLCIVCVINNNYGEWHLAACTAFHCSFTGSLPFSLPLHKLVVILTKLITEIPNYLFDQLCHFDISDITKITIANSFGYVTSHYVPVSCRGEEREANATLNN